MIDPSIQSLLNALLEPVFLLNRERRIVFMNAVADELFGRGFVERDFVRVVRHPDGLAAIAKVIDGEKQAKCNLEIEYPVRGSFQFAASRLENITSELLCLVSLKDISDLKDAEQMRSDFVANVSHELRSPLTALSGFIETLKGPAKDDDAARSRFLGLMEHEAQRMVRLIADLLSLAKVESNQRVRPKGTANISTVLSSIKNSLSAVAEKEGKTVILNMADQIIVPGSADELTQVFQNLIENAIKYGKPGSSVIVDVSAVENVAGIVGSALCVAVSDQSEGIQKEHLSRLTERFYRVDTHRSRDKGGTGLGLAIVKHIVNRHRGRFKISSEVGVGSTFSVYLPIQ